MPNVKIKYVGRKADGERAFKDQTEIEWFPGDVHDIDSKIAAEMLRHPDVFVQVSGDKVEPAPAPVLKQVAADQDEVDDHAIAREEAAKKAKAEAEAAKAAEPVVNPEHHAAKKAAHKAPKPPAVKHAAAKKGARK